MIDFNKIKSETESKQKKFGRYSLADIACFALIEAIDGMFSANARTAQAERELIDMTQKRDTWYEDCKTAEASNADLLESNREQAEEIETLRAEVAELKRLHLLRGEALDVLTAERDAARRELHNIRVLIDADDDESTLDEVAGKINQLKRANFRIVELETNRDLMAHKIDALYKQIKEQRNTIQDVTP